ncbi:MAG: DUF4157 domain-containing protein [Cyanobacteria bacterium P01_C01_bin.147]
MKTRLQRQRTATTDRSEGDRAQQSGNLGVQTQTAEPSSQPVDLQMQRATEMGHSLENFTIQPALAIGEPGDKYEQEADEIAGQAVQMKPQAGAAAGVPNENPGGSANSELGVQHQLNPTEVQRQPELDMGGSMPDMGGSGMGDIAGGDMGGDLTGAADDMGGDAMGDMADAMGSGDIGDMGDMADAMGGDGLEDMTDMAGENGIGELASAMGGDGDMGDMVEGEGPEAEEITEMLGATDIDVGMGDEGIEADIRKAMATGGEHLPEEMQAMLRSRIGMENPEDIRVHTDSAANDLCDELGALAFTTGNHIFFAAGEYDPDSPAGQELIFHEAVHTIQQGAIEGGGEEDEAMEEAGMDVGMKADQTVQQEEGEEESQEDQEDKGKEKGQEQLAAAADGIEVEDPEVEGDGQEASGDRIPSEVIDSTPHPYTPVPEVKPDAVPEPASIGETVEPEGEMSWEAGNSQAEGSVSDAFDSMAGDSLVSPEWDAALAQALIFGGEESPDLLNVQGWEMNEVSWSEQASDVNTGDAAGDYLMDNLITADTSAKVAGIANAATSFESLWDEGWAHFFGFGALALDIVIQILELITGIISLFEQVLIVILIILAIVLGILYALSWIPGVAGGIPPVQSAIVFVGKILKFTSDLVAALTLFRLLLRGVAFILWTLDFFMTWAILGWDAAQQSLAMMTQTAMGAVEDCVELAFYVAAGGGVKVGGKAIATQTAKTTGKSLTTKGGTGLIVRDASETAREVLFEEVVIGGASEGIGSLAEFGQNESTDAVGNANTGLGDEKLFDTIGQAKMDEAQIDEIRTSNDTLNEQYLEYEAEYEEEKQNLSPLPDEENPLEEVPAADYGYAFFTAEEERANAAIAETEIAMQHKLAWAEEMHVGQQLLSEHHAQQEQAEEISAAYQAGTESVASEIDDQKSTFKDAQSQGGGIAGDMRSQQSNMKSAASSSDGAGKKADMDSPDAPTDAADPADAQSQTDSSMQDLAAGPEAAGEGDKKAAKAQGEQNAQGAEAAETQGEIEGAQSQLGGAEVLNQTELEELRQQREELYEYREDAAAGREECAADREESMAEGDSWADEVQAVIQGFIEMLAAGDATEDEEEDNEAVDEEDVPDEEELAEEEEAGELPTFEEALGEFMEAWQGLAGSLGDDSDEISQESQDALLEEEPLSA